MSDLTTLPDDALAAEIDDVRMDLMRLEAAPFDVWMRSRALYDRLSARRAALWREQMRREKGEAA